MRLSPSLSLASLYLTGAKAKAWCTILICEGGGDSLLYLPSIYCRFLDADTSNAIRDAGPMS